MSTVAALASMLSACASQPTAPAKPPPVDPQTRVYAPKKHHEPPAIVAPPPAYGNKIVMAGASAPARL